MQFYLPTEICPRLVQLQEIGPIDVTIHYLQKERSECWYWLGDDIDHKNRYDDRSGIGQPDPQYVITELERKGYSPVPEEIVPGHFIAREFTLKPEIPIWFLELNELAKEAQKPVLRLEKDIPLYSIIYKKHEFGIYSEKQGQPCCWKWEVIRASSSELYIQGNRDTRRIKASSFEELVNISVQKQDQVKKGKPELISIPIKRTVFEISNLYCTEPYGEVLGDK